MIASPDKPAQPSAVGGWIGFCKAAQNRGGNTVPNKAANQGAG